MPGMDGTGPMGTGPIGGGRGPCGRGLGRGLGRGWGMGAGNRAGRGGWFGRIWGRQYPGPELMADRAALEQQILLLESDLRAARQQLETLVPPAKEE